MGIPTFSHDEAEARAKALTAPATKGDIEELRRLILSMKGTPRDVNVTFGGVESFIRRPRYQIAGARNVG